MKLFNCLLLFLLLCGTPETFAQNGRPTENSYFLHTIEKGQSLYSISVMYHVGQADIIALNPGCEEKIFAGQTIKIPQQKNKEQAFRYHTIQSKETLYQLTVKYHISAKEICDANPGLSAQNFKIGQVIIIPNSGEVLPDEAPAPQTTPAIRPEVKPNCREMHRVEKRETIFSISRQYKVSEEELIAANPEIRKGLKKGEFLCIPYEKEETSKKTNQAAPTPQTNTELFEANKKEFKKYSSIKAAIILPFMIDESSKSERLRMVEYYEGFLMAVDSLKRTGVSVDLYTYDSKNSVASIKNILTKKEMKEMDIIFGPYYASQIETLSGFSKKNKIHLVIPFSSKDAEVFNNPYIYQINTPQSYLYSEVYEHFIRKFDHANVIFLDATYENKTKSDFIAGLKEELRRHSIGYKSADAGAVAAVLEPLIDPVKENIFVLTSGSDVALIKSLPQLTILVREHPEYKIHLFGYPEWQTYTKNHLAGFYEMDTYFYSSFYTNNLFPQSIHFISAYRKWYGKEMSDTYPKYGMLGFDTAYFFLYGLSHYGSSFAENLDKINVTPIQTGFKFERASNWGGFINKKVFFVHFTKDFELVKLDFE